MCGIAGFSLTPDTTIDVQLLAASLALSIEHRGGDATGFAYRADDTVYYHKAAVNASNYLPDIFDHLPEQARSVIIHTRAATQGSPTNNDNNHPIALPGIVGIHNGVLMNDDTVARKLGIQRVAEVDSEIIFHLISQHGGIDAVGTHLDGDAAVAWMETEDNVINLAHLGGRSVAYGWVYDGDQYQGTVFASTANCLVAAEIESDITIEWTKMMELDDGDMLVLDDGYITDQKRVTPITRPWSSFGYGASKARAWTGPTVLGTPTATPLPLTTESSSTKWVKRQDPFYSDDFYWEDEFTDAPKSLRDIMSDPLFSDTIVVDWDYHGENDWGDKLWYCSLLMVFVEWIVDGSVMSHHDHQNFDIDSYTLNTVSALERT